MTLSFVCVRVKMQFPYKVDGAKAAMANFSEVGEKLLWIFFEEKLSHLRILEAPCPYGGGHPG